MPLSQLNNNFVQIYRKEPSMDASWLEEVLKRCRIFKVSLLSTLSSPRCWAARTAGWPRLPLPKPDSRSPYTKPYPWRNTGLPSTFWLGRQCPTRWRTPSQPVTTVETKALHRTDTSLNILTFFNQGILGPIIMFLKWNNGYFLLLWSQFEIKFDPIYFTIIFLLSFYRNAVWTLWGWVNK